MSASSGTSGSASGQFVAQQQQGQWLASKLIGTTVVGANNESIGDVNDVLLEKEGKAIAVVVGVGGFLGIGEKDVAIPFDSLEFTSRQAMAGTAGTGSAPRTTGAAGTSGAGTTATAPAGSAGTDRPATTASTNRDGMPDRVMVRMTKQDLQNAPKFARMGDRESTTASPARPAGSGATGTGTAPKQ